MDIKLETVIAPHPEAAILAPAAHVRPVLKGVDRDNLLCGKCSIILCEGVSATTLRARFATAVQLLIKCPACGVHNKLPAQFDD